MTSFRPFLVVLSLTAAIPGGVAPLAGLPPGQLDIDSDGAGDAVVAAPLEDVGVVPDAGTVSILYGSPQGLGAQRRIHLRQGDALSGDAAEASDQFGSAIAGGDFNGDGRVDLVIAAELEDVGGVQDAGQIHVFYNSGAPAGGFGPAQVLNQDSPGVDDQAEVGDHFGSALAVANFNGDAYFDLAVGAAWESVDSATGGFLNRAGAVHVFYGSAGGLSAASNLQEFFALTDNLATGALFGSTLAAVDPGPNNLPAMLFVGAPGGEVNGHDAAGFVTVIPAAPGTGLSAAGARRIDQDTPRMQDQAEDFDQFGTEILPTFSLCSKGAGPANRGRRVYIGVPAESRAEPFSGLVHVACISGNGRVLEDQLIELEDALAADFLGDCIAAIFYPNGPGGKPTDVVVVGAPGRQVDGKSAAGEVVVFRVDPDRPPIYYRRYSQNSPGVPGEAAPGNLFGSVCAISVAHNGSAEIAIGAPGEAVAGKAGAGVFYSARVAADSTGTPTVLNNFRRAGQRPGERPEAGDQYTRRFYFNQPFRF